MRDPRAGSTVTPENTSSRLHDGYHSDMVGGEPLVHIGYHKSGTTWLQQEVFGGSAPSFRLAWSQRAITDCFIAVNDLTFSEDVASQYLVKSRVGAADAPQGVDVLSHERLSGNPHSGGYDSRAIADRLRATIPRAKVLIVIRNQPAMILSCYKQYIHVGGTRSLQRYLAPPCRGRSRVPQFTLAFFEYHRLIAYYQSLFGHEHVLVLPFESLAVDASAFVERIALFAGAHLPQHVSTSRRNVSMSGLGVRLQRPLNFFFVRDTVNPSAPFDLPRVAGGLCRGVKTLDRLFPRGLRSAADRPLLRTVASSTAGYFAESNRRTAELTGLDLSAFGYEL